MNQSLAARMPLLLLAVAILATAGCTGLPEGSAEFGDTVQVRYTVMDANGTVLRPQNTAQFLLGSGESGLGMGFERALRGQLPGDNLTFTVADDPSLAFGDVVEVERVLPSIPQTDMAPRADYERSQGPASVGQSFPYSFYLVRVTGVDANFVNLTIEVEPDQRNFVPAVGATLVSNGDGQTITRRLDPNVGATFTVNPPTPQQPQTPLGLEPGVYRTLGATDDEIQYGYSTSSSPDLIGRTLQFKATILRITPGQHVVEPVDGNYAKRESPYVNGDPDSVLGLEPTDDGHSH